MTRTLSILVLTAATCAISAVPLTIVPMQGSMLMPEVYYHEDSDSVTVDLSAILVKAQLTPLLVSNPTNSFLPEDPWFDSLDPSRQGLAFSRRYGFNISAMSDYLPANRQLWIRKISGSPELGIYDYNANSTPKIWTPIFGTDGTGNEAYWSGLMWHVGVTAPPGTNSFTATFEVYVLNTDNGREVPRSSSGPFVLDWTNVPDGRPELDIAIVGAGKIQLAWPESATLWSLVSAATSHAANWSVVTNLPANFNGRFTIILDAPKRRNSFV